MKTSMCENCIKYKTIYCPNSDKCLAREDKPFYEDKYTILTRNEALEEVLKDYKKENKQLKEKLDCDLQWAFKYEKQVDNWNKLKEYIQEICCYDEVGLRIIDPSYLEDKIAELERGVSDE